jgi:hypothetical protein
LPAAADVDAFHHWYDHVHLPEITDCPGFESGVRYSAAEPGPDGERYFLAVYAIDGPEALSSKEFSARRGFGPFAQQVTFTTRVYERHRPTVVETRR